MIFFADLFAERESQKFYDVTLGSYTFPTELILIIVGLLAIPTLLYTAMAARASKRQTELSTVPMLLLNYHESDQKMHLENLNGKFACNLSIERFYVRNLYDNTIYTIDFCLPDNKTYTNGTQNDIALDVRIKENGKPTNMNMATLLVNHLGSEVKTTAAVTFVDSQGFNYFARVRFESGTLHIVRPPTRLTILWRMWLLLRKLNDMLSVVWWLVIRRLKRVTNIF